MYNSLKMDSISLKNDHYHLLYSAYNHEILKPKSIIFLGNSLTESGNWNSLLKNKNVLNRGISGDITAGILYRLNEITRHQPSKLFIEIGINDIANNIPLEQTINNYIKIIGQVKKESPGTKIYIQSLLPVNTKKTGLNKDYNTEIIEINKELSKLTLKYQVGYVNIYPVMLNEEKELKKEYTTDGVHLTKKGYKAWVTYLKKQNYL